jgi:hypothetical protein
VKLAVALVLAVAAFAVLAGASAVPAAHAQITSISGPDQPPALLRGVCFATVANQERHFRVEEVRNNWIRVSTAPDKNQTNSFVNVQTRWLNALYLVEVVTLTGPKACDFPE